MRTNLYRSSIAAVICALAAPALTGSSPATASPQTPPPTESELEAMFIVGPAALKSIGVRTVWQTQVPLRTGERATDEFIATGDSVFVLDSGCHLWRILNSGARPLWSNACGKETDRVRSVNRVLVARSGFTAREIQIGNRPAVVKDQTTVLQDEVLVTLDTEVVALDSATGVLTATHKLTRLPRTSGVVFDQHLIFGAKGGQVAWQQLETGSFWRANSLGGTVDHAPILLETNPPAVLAASSSGELALLNATNTHQIWRRKLGGPILYKLGVGAEGVYAACGDNSITAVELGSGKPRWRYMANEEPTSDVLCDGEQVYAQIANVGLIAIEARPVTVPMSPERKAEREGFTLDGKLKWTCATASGNPICRIGSQILLWDSVSCKLTTVDSTNGIVVEQVPLSKGVQVVLTGNRDPDIYFLSPNGTLQRCESTARAVAAAQATSVAPNAQAAPSTGEASSNEPTAPTESSEPAEPTEP